MSRGASPAGSTLISNNGKGEFVEAVTGGMWDEVIAALEKAER